MDTKTKSDDTRKMLVEALGVSEQVKLEYVQLRKQNDYLEQLLDAAEENLLKDSY